jgi:RNA polymerase sigma-70 factor (ECF subfamily)
MSDESTFQRTADVEADREWLQSAYKQHRAGLIRFVLGVTRNYQTAHDVVQATFAKAAQSDAAFPDEGGVKAWLYRVAFHEAVTWKRRSDAARKAARTLWESGHDRRPESPDEPLVRREIVEQVRQALQYLSAAQQQVVHARIYEEKTFAQIAAEQGLPLGTVLTHMRRGLETLRRKLNRDG